MAVFQIFIDVMFVINNHIGLARLQAFERTAADGTLRPAGHAANAGFVRQILHKCRQRLNFQSVAVGIFKRLFRKPTCRNLRKRNRVGRIHVRAKTTFVQHFGAFFFHLAVHAVNVVINGQTDGFRVIADRQVVGQLDIAEIHVRKIDLIASAVADFVADTVPLVSV